MEFVILYMMAENFLCYAEEIFINSLLCLQVLAIFQEVGVNSVLYFLVFGESLLNGKNVDIQSKFVFQFRICDILWTFNRFLYLSYIINYTPNIWDFYEAILSSV